MCNKELLTYLLTYLVPCVFYYSLAVKLVINTWQSTWSTCRIVLHALRPRWLPFLFTRSRRYVSTFCFCYNWNIITTIYCIHRIVTQPLDICWRNSMLSRAQSTPGLKICFLRTSAWKFMLKIGLKMKTWDFDYSGTRPRQWCWRWGVTKTW